MDRRRDAGGARPLVDQVDQGLAGDDDHAATRADLARSASDQGVRADDLLRRRSIAVEPSEQELRCGPPELGRIVRDDRDGRIEQVGEREVIEPDERDLVLECERAERLDRADREVVLPGDEGGRGLGAQQHLEHGLLGLFHRDEAGANVRVLQLRAELAHRLAISLEAVACRLDRERRSEIGDSPVAPLAQVGDRRPCATGVVRGHAVGVEKAGSAIDEDHGRPQPEGREEVAVVGAGRYDDDAVDPPGA